MKVAIQTKKRGEMIQGHSLSGLRLIFHKYRVYGVKHVHKERAKASSTIKVIKLLLN